MNKMRQFRLMRAPHAETWQNRETVVLQVYDANRNVYVVQIYIDELGKAVCTRAAKNKSGKSRAMRGGIITKRVDKAGG